MARARLSASAGRAAIGFGATSGRHPANTARCGHESWEVQMRHRLTVLLVGAALVVGACGAGTPSEGASGSPAASQPPASSGSPAPSTAAGTPDLFGTEYAPEEGTDGGTLIIGDWQEANLFNPFYLVAADRGERRVGDVGDARRLHPRLQVRAGPRRGHPDARQRRRPGAGRGRRRDDREVDAPGRPQVVGRRAAHVRRLQVRLGVGPRSRPTSAS